MAGLPVLLLLPERSAGRSLAFACAAALDIHMIRMAFIIGIINAFHCLAIDTDGSAGVNDGACKGISALSFLNKAFAAGPVTAAGMLSAYHNVAFAAQMLRIVIVGTIFHRTF